MIRDVIMAFFLFQVFHGRHLHTGGHDHGGHFPYANNVILVYPKIRAHALAIGEETQPDPALLVEPVVEEYEC